MNSILHQLYEYNRYYNEQFLGCLAEHEHPAQCRRLLAHVLNTHHIWLRRAQGKPVRLALWEEHPLARQLALNHSLHEETFQLLNETPDPTLGRPIFYQNNAGRSYVNRLTDILHHLINHSTHHRAQVALLLRQTGITPPGSDYIFYQRGDHLH